LFVDIIIDLNMLKQIILVLLVALILAQDICPQKLVIACEKDAELGKDYFMQPTSSVRRPRRRRVPTRLLTSTV
jgi:hypothetical protein